MKILRRAMVVWCLYGVGKLFIMVNPLLFWIVARAFPYYRDNSQFKTIASVEWNSRSLEQILWVWFWAVLAIGIAAGIVAGIHYAAKAIFNESD